MIIRKVRQRLKQLNIQYFAISQVVLLAILLFNCVHFFSYTTNQINSITKKVKQFETNIALMSNLIRDIKSTLKEAFGPGMPGRGILGFYVHRRCRPENARFSGCHNFEFSSSNPILF